MQRVQTATSQLLKTTQCKVCSAFPPSQYCPLMLDLIESPHSLPRQEPVCRTLEAVVTKFKVTHLGHVSCTLP